MVAITKDGIPREEMETICNYDALEQCWYIESTYRSHITKLLKQYDNVEIISQLPSGTPTQVRVKLTKDLITFRKPMTVSEETKQKRTEALKKARQNKK